jgi:hypothetical protein
MKRGCSGDDRLPPSGGPPPGKKKGKGRAKTPPPRERTPEPEPEPDSLAYGNVPGRNPDMVAWEQFEAELRLNRSGAAIESEADIKAAEDLIKAEEPKIKAYKQKEEARIREEQRKEQLEQRSNEFRGIPLEVFALFLSYVPFPHLLRFMRTCKFTMGFCEEDIFIRALIESFRLSFGFVGDFSVMLRHLNIRWPNRRRLEHMRDAFKNYFGNRMSRNGRRERDSHRVILRDFFPEARKSSSGYDYCHEGFTVGWLLRSFAPNRDTSLRTYLNLPLSCISVLRYSGIFSTFRTRQAFISSLIHMMDFYHWDSCFSFRVMLNFFLRLTSDSFAFNYMAVDSRTFRQPGRLRQLEFNGETVLSPIIDISEQQFNLWVSRFKMLYGEHFIQVVYYFPPGWL